MLGMGLALLGALGDLAESAIKRSVNVKDSGAIIPGHGGVLVEQPRTRGVGAVGA